MSDPKHSHPGESGAEVDSDYSFDSSEQQKSPRLSHRALTLTLTLMCLIPVATIAAMWVYLPNVYEGQLNAAASAEGLPGKEFYAVDYYKRPEFDGGYLIIQNKGEQDWTHLNVRVNGNYEVYDTEPIKAHEEKRYELSRFLNRSGARFSLQYNELSSLRIYARRPTKDRATYYQDFPTHFSASSSIWTPVILIGVFLILFLIAAGVFVKLSAANEPD